MATNLNNLDEIIDGAIAQAEEATDEKLGAEISSLTTLTDKEIAELFPTPADVEKLNQLIEIVKSADSQNQKINRVVKDIDGLAGTIVTLLGKFT